MPISHVVAAAPKFLVGRDREQRRLHEHLAAARDGHGNLVLIGGEAGIGKTTLGEALCREAERSGARALIGRCYDRTKAPPYGLWSDLFAGWPRLGDGGSPPVPFAQHVTTGNAVSPTALMHQVRDFVAAITTERPLVLLLDDLHWADADSLDLLRYLARVIATIPILIIGTYRGEEVPGAHPLAELLPQLVREAPTDRIVLHPFAPDDLHRLVWNRYTLEEPDAARLVTYLAQRTGGIPLYTDELLRTLEDMRLLRTSGWGHTLGDLTAVPVPSLLRQIVDHRLTRLGEETQRLLSAAAVIGPEVPLAVWETVTAAAPDTIFDAIDQAAAIRLIEASADGAHIRFVHNLIHEALYEAVPPPRRRAWHARISEALIAQPAADPDIVAHHLRMAGDRRTAVWIYRAGARATATNAYATAAERYEDAITLLTALSSTAHANKPFPSEAENQRLAAHVRFDLGLLRGLSGDFPRALADMRAAVEALSALSAAESEPLAALLDDLNVPADRRGMFANWLAYAGRYEEARTIAERVVAEDAAAINGRRREKTYGDACSALVEVYGSRGQVEAAWQAYANGRERLRTGNHLTNLAIIATRALLSVVLPYRTDDVAARRYLVTEIEEVLCQATGVVAGLAPRIAHLPMLPLEGAWAEAHSLGMVLAGRELAGSSARQWVTTARARGIGGLWRMIPWHVLGPLARAQGNPELAWSVIREAFPAGPSTVPGETFHSAALVLQRIASALACDANDPDTACVWLEMHDRWLAWNDTVIGQAEGHCSWAAYYRQTGDRSRAYARARHALAAATVPRQPIALLAAHRLLGELMTESGRFGDARGHLKEALALADGCAAPYERALTLLSIAEIDILTGAHDTARGTLADASAVFAALVARPALARADALAARLPAAGLSRSADLTTREIAVLRLIATGLTNRQIAAELSISLGTVKTHVLHIFEKTLTENRAAATAFAQRHGLV